MDVGLPKLQVAGAADAPALLALRDAAAAWLSARGVRQWEPGEIGLDEIMEQVAAGEWHVLRSHAATPVAALRLVWDDDAIWGVQPPIAGYVHGLVVDRALRGRGVGEALLRWGGAQVAARGRSLLRLDCGEENAVLRGYYGRQGFQIVGRRDFDGRWYSVVLLERDLSDAAWGGDQPSATSP